MALPDSDAEAGTRTLAGRHALVTGGSRGIGAACATALAEHGAALTLVGRTAASLEERAAAIAHAGVSEIGWFAADVTDQAAFDKGLGDATQARGEIAVLINNAGGATSAPLEALDEANWNDTLTLNLTVAYRTMRQVIPGMKAAGWGRIVNIASVAGLHGYAYIAAYCAAKHGLVGLTRAAAVELAKTGITVNAVCPGYVDTDMSQESVERIVEKTGRSKDEAQAALTATNPQGRLIQPKEVADAVLFLCLPAAASITGTALPIAGGEVT